MMFRLRLPKLILTMAVLWVVAMWTSSMLFRMSSTVEYDDDDDDEAISNNRVNNDQSQQKRHSNFEQDGDENEDNYDSLEGDTHLPTIEIFTWYKPKCTHQKQSVSSWLDLGPQVKAITLFCMDCTNARKFADSTHGNNGIRVQIEPQIDFNSDSKPLLNSILQRSGQSDQDVSVVVDSELRFDGQEMMDAINFVGSKFSRWAGIVTPRDVFTPITKEVKSSGEWVRKNGMLDLDDSKTVWIFSNDGKLYTSPETIDDDVRIPPFVFDKPGYLEWMVHHLVTAQTRKLVSLTKAVTIYRMMDDHSSDEIETLGHNSQYATNLYFARSVPEKLESTGSRFVELKFCSMHRLCFESVKKWPMVLKKLLSGSSSASDGGSNSKSRQSNEAQLEPDLKSFAPTLDTLLSSQPDPSTKTVVLTVAGYEQRYQLMSFACNLRRLSIRNLIIAAIDEDMFTFAFVRGLSVYSLAGSGEISTDCSMNNGCFEDTSMRIVRDLLKRGFSVLVSDSDMIWFQNPIGHLAHLYAQYRQSNTEGLVLVQSASSDITVWLINHRLERSNHGRIQTIPNRQSNQATIAAFGSMLARLKRGLESGSQVFTRTLCSPETPPTPLHASTSPPTTSLSSLEDEQNQEIQMLECYSRKHKIRTLVLDRRQYSNGGFDRVWTRQDLSTAFPNIKVLHNNWMSGLEDKLARQKQRGWFFYQDQSDTCRYDRSSIDSKNINDNSSKAFE